MNAATVVSALLACVLALQSVPAQGRAPNPVVEQARKMPLGAIAGQRPLRFGFHDGTRDVTVEVIGSLVRARTATGPFPESRTVRRGPALFYLDGEGGVRCGLHLWPGGGRMQLFSERFRLRLGVSMNVPSVDKRVLYRLPVRAALEVVDIEEDGVAWRAGVRQGDVLTAIDGARPVNRTTLRQALTAARPGGPMAWPCSGGERCSRSSSPWSRTTGCSWRSCWLPLGPRTRTRSPSS